LPLQQAVEALHVHWPGGHLHAPPQQPLLAGLLLALLLLLQHDAPLPHLQFPGGHVQLPHLLLPLLGREAR